MAIMARHMMPGLSAEAEKGGRFRGLIPLSEVDTTRVGHWQNTVHPQCLEGRILVKGHKKARAAIRNLIP